MPTKHHLNMRLETAADPKVSPDEIRDQVHGALTRDWNEQHHLAKDIKVNKVTSKELPKGVGLYNDEPVHRHHVKVEIHTHADMPTRKVAKAVRSYLNPEDSRAEWLVHDDENQVQHLDTTPQAKNNFAFKK